ncbi:thiolase family protein [Spirobacillus cienkowskii]|jgi:acetyl-CoA C-acetyltransferase|uniref:Thiolase family protein n=1 Tax=Spirobacillus cienkowskii TaxID=495820 RepID=A0A369KY26_9BACT|nr:MAG: thiolase family protein [Spirobacillus cienkowskii]
MSHAYIVAAKRTPIGRFQGVFKNMSAPRLGAVVVKNILESTGLNASQVEEIMMGEVLTAGVGQAPARQTALYAGLPQSVRAVTIGKVCGSGMQSIILAAQSVMLGDSHCVIAGGQENMTLAPYLLPMARDGMRMGHKELLDSMIYDGLWDPYDHVHMGNCAEACVQEHHFTRQQQDEFAIQSYLKAQNATTSGLFKNEIVPVNVEQGKSTVLIDKDEEPFASDLNKVANLKPAFDKNGSITAANSSKINDGAAALLVVSESFMKQNNLKPLAKIISWSGHAHEPKWFTTAPVAAMENALKKANLTMKEIDLYEINEAFAVVALYAIKKLSLPPEKVNIHGGACALGHPIGASGARIVTTLLNALQQQQKKLGMASLCIGGGEGLAIIIENCSKG